MQFIIEIEGGAAKGLPMLLSNARQTIEEIRRLDKISLESDDIAEFGYGVFVHTIPEVNRDTTKQYVEVPATNQDLAGNWLQKWVLNDILFASESLRNYEELATKTLHRELILRSLKEKFNVVSLRPRVDTSLGFAVDGSHADLLNFQVGHDLGVLTVRDADNISHEVELSDYAGIILSIKQKGLSLISQNWDFKDLINSVDLDLDTAKAELDSIDIEFV